MEVKLFDSELKIMDVLWDAGSASAKQISNMLTSEFGWSKPTVYTLIKRCIDKGAMRQKEPDFVCMPLLSRNSIRRTETKVFIAGILVASLLGSEVLKKEEIVKLK